MFGMFISKFSIGNRLTGFQKLSFNYRFNIVLSYLVTCAGVLRVLKCLVSFVVQFRDAFSASMLSVVPECWPGAHECVLKMCCSKWFVGMDKKGMACLV